MIKYLDKSNLRGGCLRFQSVMAGKSQKQEYEVAGHLIFTGKEQRAIPVQLAAAAAPPPLPPLPPLLSFFTQPRIQA